jgi:EAL domain-containing protein (putative c-di-GMP-specific phosphodiesterase class I)
VIAEGVETEAQAAFLLDMGCEVAQGYLYSHPVTASQFTELLEAQRLKDKASKPGGHNNEDKRLK